MLELRSVLDQIAATESSVLLSGESGTGKELAANALHLKSGRADKPFVPVNCATVSESLLERDLFGSVADAVLIGDPERAGLIRQAEGGTLFFDEIGDLPLSLQPKLLRVLEERRIRPVGAERESPINVRIIAATNKLLEHEVAEGRFREDLYFRINVINVALPPLRARGDDVLLLSDIFIRAFSARFNKKVIGLTHAVSEKLLAYEWPGNVRELRNCLERAVALTRVDRLVVEDLPEKIRAYKKSALRLDPTGNGPLESIEEVEQRHILRVLREVGGNKAMAAKVLGLDRKTLYRKLERYDEAK